MSKQRLNGEDNVKHFAMIPNMADDDLDPFQYRLYGHYRRVCGEHGECWESTRTTAKMTKMSVGKVVETRRELHALGYITIEEVDSETLHITIKNVWAQNAKRYAERSPHERSVHHMNAKRSPHEPKNNTSKNNQEESIAPDGAEIELAPIANAEKPTRKANPLYDVVLEVWGASGALNGRYQKFLTAQPKHQWREYNVEPPMTPDEIREWAKWYRKVEAHGDPKLTMLASPAKVQSSIAKWRRQKASGIMSPERAETLRRIQAMPTFQLGAPKWEADGDES